MVYIQVFGNASMGIRVYGVAFRDCSAALLGVQEAHKFDKLPHS